MLFQRGFHIVHLPSFLVPKLLKISRGYCRAVFLADRVGGMVYGSSFFRDLREELFENRLR